MICSYFKQSMLIVFCLYATIASKFLMGDATSKPTKNCLEILGNDQDMPHAYVGNPLKGISAFNFFGICPQLSDKIQQKMEEKLKKYSTVNNLDLTIKTDKKDVDRSFSLHQRIFF